MTDEITEEQPEKKKMMYLDRIIRLVDNSTLIGRLLMDDDKKMDDFIYVHSPIEIFFNYDTGDYFLHPWIPSSKDVVYTIPLNKVMNLSRPSNHVLQRYIDGFKSTKQKKPDTKEVNDDSKKEPTLKDRLIAEFTDILDHDGVIH